MDEESLRHGFVEFLVRNNEEVARAACDAVPREYPYMPSLVSSQDTYEWMLSELNGLIDAYAQDDVSMLDYRGFKAWFVLYSADPFRALFNYLDLLYFLARFVASYYFDQSPSKGPELRSILKLFDDFVSRALRYNMQYFLDHNLDSGILLDSLDSSIAAKSQPRHISDGTYLQNSSVDRAVSTALTARELEMCRLVAQGLSNKEIAARADISVTTVKTHLSSILSKLHLGNRTEIALWYSQEGSD